MSHKFDQVIARDMCVGCGVCPLASGGQVPVVFGVDGLFRAVPQVGLSPDARAALDRVCPFSDGSENEDALSAELFPDLRSDPRLGRVRGSYVGRIADDASLPDSSSGGLTSWLLRKLVAGGHVNGVIHVGESAGPSMFGYTVSRTIDEINRCRKSRYAPVTLDSVLSQVRGDGLRYAVVGVPCFIKAVRLLAREDAEFGAQIAFTIGILCGHWKGEMFGQSLGWQAGIQPDRLASVDFRVKDRARASNDYDAAATDRDGVTATLRMRDALDGNWGYAAFQPEACNFCDDIFAETADVCFGDAWLPQYKSDWRGTNVVVTRDPLLDSILRDGVAEGEIFLEAASEDEIARSQGGNIRHRRDGLAVRLMDDIDAGLSVPAKRVNPGRARVTPKRIRLVRHRRAMARESFAAFAAARDASDIRVYQRRMGRLIRTYRRVDGSLLRSVLSRARKALRSRSA